MTRRRALGLALAGATLAAYPVARGVRSLAMTRGAVTTYARIIAAANAGDVAAVRPLCSTRYLETHPPVAAREGGIVGFPRQVHPNFRAWVAGDEVLLCPGDRVGRVERFVAEGGRWRYAGVVGSLMSDGSLVPIPAVDPGAAENR